MSLALQERDRDAIVTFLESIVVPANIGANIMQVTALLKNLPQEVEIPKNEQ